MLPAARPTGVTVIAILCFLAASSSVLGFALLIVKGDTTVLLREQPAAGNLAELGTILIFFDFVLTAVYGAAGWGLWKLRGWGRVLTIALVAMGAALDLFRRLLRPQVRLSSSVEAAVTLTIYGLVAWYLLRPQVKAAFTST